MIESTRSVAIAYFSLPQSHPSADGDPEVFVADAVISFEEEIFCIANTPAGNHNVIFNDILSVYSCTLDTSLTINL
jgi:hypothetical protein